MENVVYYTSRNKEGDKSKIDYVGNVASAIAAGAQTSAYAIGKHTFVANTGILFIGCEVHGKGKIPSSFRSLLRTLDSTEVKCVAIFSIIKSGTITAVPNVKNILESRGIKICAEEFSCKRSTAFRNRGCPTELDFQKAKEFGAMIISKYRNY
jgi:flavodoxin